MFVGLGEIDRVLGSKEKGVCVLGENQGVLPRPWDWDWGASAGWLTRYCTEAADQMNRDIGPN